MKIEAVEPAPGIDRTLIGADFIDAYRVKIAATGLDATTAARLLFAQPPWWVGRLLALRNALVAPFGLKTGRERDDLHAKIGIFPIESSAPHRVVLGFADKHLDFRVVVDTVQAAGASEVTATTLVRRHNRLGRIYLAAILPFHKLIVRSLLERMATRWLGGVRDGNGNGRTDKRTA